MSNAIKKLHDYLAKSPSVVYPQDVLAYLPAIEADNAKLRELVRDLWEACPTDGYYCIYHCEHYDKESESHCKLEDRMRELGVDV